jgi:type IV pilus assembly protein PilE
MIKIQKGFTLIELLVVIAIIGILAGILFVAIDPAAQTNKAEDAKAKSQLSQARTQSAISFSDSANNDYADVCTDIDPLVDNCNTSPSA